MKRIMAGLALAGMMGFGVIGCDQGAGGTGGMEELKEGNDGELVGKDGTVWVNRGGTYYKKGSKMPAEGAETAPPPPPMKK